jgi:hypothetical protein
MNEYIELQTRDGPNFIRIVSIKNKPVTMMYEPIKFTIEFEILDPTLTKEDFAVFLDIFKSELNKELHRAIQDGEFLI